MALRGEGFVRAGVQVWPLSLLCQAVPLVSRPSIVAPVLDEISANKGADLTLEAARPIRVPEVGLSHSPSPSQEGGAAARAVVHLMSWSSIVSSRWRW